MMRASARPSPSASTSIRVCGPALTRRIAPAGAGRSCARNGSGTITSPKLEKAWALTGSGMSASKAWTVSFPDSMSSSSVCTVRTTAAAAMLVFHSRSGSRDQQNTPLFGDWWRSSSPTRP